jgi:hypothetical protein
MLTTTVLVPPLAAIVPNDIGSEDPVAEPREAVVNSAFAAAPAPLLVAVTVAL